MYKYRLMVLLMAVLAFPVRAKTTEYQLYYTPQWQQGGMINAFIYPSKDISTSEFFLEQVSARNTKSAYVRSKGKGFSYQVKGLKKEQVHLMLIGISALVPVDTYQLRVVLTLKDGSKQELWSEEHALIAGSYTRQTIKMGEQGQSVANNQSAERQAQAQRFYAALALFESDVMYDEGIWQMPLEGSKWYYTSRYGAVREFIYPNGSKSSDFHNGEDFAGLPVGTPVYAVASGRVVLAENRVVTGYTAIVMHAPGVFSLYYHMDDLHVKTGDMIKRGSQLGALGGTGFATGPHLHLTAYSQGQEVDPQWLFNNALINETWLITRLKALKFSK